MLRKNVKVHKQKRKKDFNLNRSITYFLILTILFCFKASAQETISNKEDIKSIELLEERIFHQKFEEDTIKDRLSKIERFVFGKESKERDLTTRINNLSEALNKPEKTPELFQPKPLPKITPEKIIEETNIKPEAKVLYGESFNTGVLGKVKEIEIKLYGT